MSTTKPIKASQNASCLLVSICLLGLAVAVPFGLSSLGMLAKTHTSGFESWEKCAEARGVLRDSAQTIRHHPARTSARNVYAVVTVEVVVTQINDGTWAANVM